MRAMSAFEPGDVPTGHDTVDQMELEAGEVIHVNVGGARAPDGMVKASRLTDEAVQGFVPFLLLEDLDEADTKVARRSFRSSRGISLIADDDDDNVVVAGVRAGPALLGMHGTSGSSPELMPGQRRIAQVHGVSTGAVARHKQPSDRTRRS
jgi:hypothetical protein